MSNSRSVGADTQVNSDSSDSRVKGGVSPSDHDSIDDDDLVADASYDHPYYHSHYQPTTIIDSDNVDINVPISITAMHVPSTRNANPADDDRHVNASIISDRSIGHMHPPRHSRTHSYPHLEVALPPLPSSEATLPLQRELVSIPTSDTSYTAISASTAAPTSASTGGGGGEGTGAVSGGGWG